MSKRRPARTVRRPVRKAAAPPPRPLPARITVHRMVMVRARKRADAAFQRAARAAYRKAWLLLKRKLPLLKLAKAVAFDDLPPDEANGVRGLLDPATISELQRTIEQGLQAGAAAAATHLAAGEASWFTGAGRAFVAPSADDVLHRYTQMFAKDVPGGFKDTSQTVADAVTDEVKQWMADPEPGLGALQSSLSRWFAPNRADMIAATETTRMQTATSQLIGQQLGATQCEVDSANDQYVCSECVDAEANNPYPFDGSEPQPPLHVQCRCGLSIVPPGMEDDAEPDDAQQ